MALRKSNTLIFNTLRQYSTDNKYVGLSMNGSTGVATVTLQRPPVNGLNLELLTELSATFKELEKNKVRGMIITSTNKNVFSAGLDIMEMYNPIIERTKVFWTAVQDVWIQLYGSSFPTSACINGHTPAGGCVLALSCEHRVMLNNFTIGLNETQLGLVAPTWFMSTMESVIGKREAEKALLPGTMFDTKEALKIGLIDETAANMEQALSKSEKYLETFAHLSQFAVSQTKSMIRNKMIDELVQNRERDYRQFMDVITRDSVQKGLGLYLEKLKKQAKK